MQVYLDLVKRIMEEGTDREDRTGVGTRSIFGTQMRFDLSKGFPLLTTKKVHLKSIIHELLWFISGSTNIHYLTENGVRIWNEWADENGDLGPVYGKQWRDFETPDGRHIDQLKNDVDMIKHHPESLRLIVCAWNPGDIERMALPPCHTLYQFYVANGKLSCQLYQRSCDMFLGVPFNIASYSLLTMMIAKDCDLEVGDFVWTGGDTHIYHNHFDQVKLQLTRTPRALPQMIIKRKAPSIFDYVYDDFSLEGYNPYPAIKAKVAV